ncbi:MAG: hypothetical protein IKJ82_03485 [Oscillospiraceae bacterium]|nr:hypothetical protein [Oscillospiraceae bacterium]
MKMKIFSCVFAALLCVIFCSCSEEAPKPVLPSEPESIPEESVPTEEEENLLYGYVSADEISEEAKKDKEYFDRFIENDPYPERPYGYIYVVDENGEPVMNLRAFDEDQWWEYNEIGISKGINLSMPGGLLPVTVKKSSEAEMVTFVLANTFAEDAEEICITVNLDRLANGEFYKVLWTEEKPMESLEKSGAPRVYIESFIEKDLSRMVVYAMDFGGGAEIEVPAMGSEEPQEAEGNIGGKNYYGIPLYIGSGNPAYLDFGGVEVNSEFELIIAETEDRIILANDILSMADVFAPEKEYHITID